MPIFNGIIPQSELLTLAGFLLTAGLILMWRGWRLALFSLFALYLILGASLAEGVSSGVALVKPLVGVMVLLILYPAGFRLQQERLPTVTRWPFRMAMFLLAGVGAYGLHFRFPWPDVPDHLGYAAWWLMLSGLFIIFLATDPFRAGIGLLVYETGFEAGFTVLEPGLLVAGFLGVLQILLALATSYLTTSRAAAVPSGPSSEGRASG